MTRNLDYRVEVGCPIYDPEIKQELKDTFEICWGDNTKARIFTENQDNIYRDGQPPIRRSQFETYDYYLKKGKKK